MNFFELMKLTIELENVIIGERVKGGIYRPCVETIPSSTLSGMFKYYLGKDIVAVGIFDKESYVIKDFSYSVHDKMLRNSKMPFFTQYLAPKKAGERVIASIYMPCDSYDKGMFNLHFQIGALKSKGFGKGRISRQCAKCDYKIKQGILDIKIFENECSTFGINLKSPMIGYLFKPDSNGVDGRYKRAVFPGSLVEAPEVFLKDNKETFYD